MRDKTQIRCELEGVWKQGKSPAKEYCYDRKTIKEYLATLPRVDDRQHHELALFMIRLASGRTAGVGAVFDILPHKKMASVDVLSPRIVLWVAREVDGRLVIDV
eukprot:4638572-Pleurochrysis_carterae.AAC.2